MRVLAQILGWFGLIAGILAIIGGEILGLIPIVVGIWILWASKHSRSVLKPKRDTQVEKTNSDSSDVSPTTQSTLSDPSLSDDLRLVQEYRLASTVVNSHDGTVEIVFTNMAGINIHLYNLSPQTAQYILQRYESIVTSAENTVMVGYNGLDVSEQRWLIMLEDIRCRELDEYVRKYKDAYEQFKASKQYIYFDDIPEVEFVPQGADLDMLFSYPSEKAESMRRRLKEFLASKKVNRQAMDTYIRLLGKYLVEGEHYMEYYRDDIRALFEADLVVPLEDAGMEVMLRYFKMQQLRMLAQNMNLQVKARRKDELVNQIITLSNPNELREHVSTMLKELGRRVFYVSLPPSDLITEDEFKWFVKYSQALADVIFGTLNIAAWNTVNVLVSKLESSNLTIVNNHPCKYCKSLIGQSVVINEKSDLKKLPPFHIGCKCRLERSW